MKIGLNHVGLAIGLALAALAGACGPAPTAETPADKTPAGTTTAAPAGTDQGATGTTPAPSATPSATPTAPSGDAGGKTGTTPAPAAGGGEKSVPIAASKMIEDLKKLGVNVDKIPELSKIPLNTKKKVMPLMQKALGYSACTGCHVEGDFKAETRNMKISREMWKAYSVNLRDEKGGAVFCDTCHSGQAKVLARGDKEALKKFMEDEYEHKLTRADKKDMECATCHGDTMELKIIEKLWKIPAEAKK
jgi:hypothetical protein